MATYTEVYFEKEKPSISQIELKLRKKTGLQINVSKDVFGYMIQYNGKHNLSFTLVEFEYHHKDKVAVIGFREIYKNYYLKCIFIRVLVELGGIYNKSLPNWSNMKWLDKKWYQFIPR